ncbi:LPS export ABC transporter periplasmic protein LptC [Ampullimonas aquatilis]|uniref:LPS export ABC transporter periplasmic protein LptC n=1 Tax=Ampullimonas aquatilis TaxID=1341549 RepID=UPI003C70E9E7
MLSRLQTFLPAFILLAIAGWTLWLLQGQTPQILPTAAKPLRHDPDYFVEDFKIISVNQFGYLKAVLAGRQMSHFPDVDNTEIINPLHVSLTYQEQKSAHPIAQPLVTTSALRAMINTDGSEIRLYDNALISRASQVARQVPEMQLASRYMLLKPDDDIIESDQKTVMTRGMTHLQGNSFYLNNVTREVKLNGTVRGQIVNQSTDQSTYTP